jgi:hypothetical protein
VKSVERACLVLAGWHRSIANRSITEIAPHRAGCQELQKAVRQLYVLWGMGVESCACQ